MALVLRSTTRLNHLPLCRPSYVAKRSLSILRRPAFTNTVRREQNLGANNAGGTNHDQQNKKALITWKSVAVALVAGTSLWIYFDYTKARHMAELKKPQSIGDAAIGGPFNLVTHNGVPVSDMNFRGKYLLIYFGFTYCPDICPTELKKMAAVIDKLEQNGFADKIVPLFITIDPWRDTVDQTRAYIKEFHPRMIGLTGTPKQIIDLAKSYRVYVSKAGGDEDYLVDHSIILYLIGPDGKFIGFYGKTADENEVFTQVMQQISGRNSKETEVLPFGEYLKTLLGFNDAGTTQN